MMKGGHDQTKSRCAKLGYCKGMVEEFGGEVGELGRSPPPTLAGHMSLLSFYTYRLCDAPIQLCSTI